MRDCNNLHLLRKDSWRKARTVLMDVAYVATQEAVLDKRDVVTTWVWPCAATPRSDPYPVVLGCAATPPRTMQVTVVEHGALVAIVA